MFDKYFCRKFKRNKISMGDIIEYYAIKYKELLIVVSILLILKIASLLYPLYVDNALYTVIFIILSGILSVILNLFMKYTSSHIIVAICPYKKD